MSGDMKLPEGKTCADCAHFQRCVMLFGCPATNTSCDWAPSRFRHVAAESFTPHLGTVLQIIRYGLAGDAEHVRAYTGLLAEKLDEAGDVRGAAALRRYAAGDFGRQIVPLVSGRFPHRYPPESEFSDGRCVYCGEMGVTDHLPTDDCEVLRRASRAGAGNG